MDIGHNVNNRSNNITKRKTIQSFDMATIKKNFARTKKDNPETSTHCHYFSLKITMPQDSQQQSNKLHDKYDKIQ